MRSLLLVTAFITESSVAFVPVSNQKTTPRVPLTTSTRQRRRVVPLKDLILVDPKDSSESSSILDPQEDFSSILSLTSSTSLNTPQQVVSSYSDTTANTNTVDEGAEIFLNSILQTKPDDVLAGADAALDSMFAADSGDSSNYNNNRDNSNDGYNEESTAPSSSYESFVDPSINDDLKVVLEASGAAAAAAEASMEEIMSEDLLQQLDLIPASTTNTNENSTTGLSSSPLSTATTDQVSEILPASSVVGESATAVAKVEAPSVKKILKFAIPAIGVWLCSPLLSLIDTSAVGVLSGTVQQAALNPAVAVTDYAALLIAFMYTGATNLVAAARETDRSTADKPTSTKAVIGAMQLSTYVGTGLGIVLFAFARPLLTAIIGNDSISPAVFAAAMKYVRIRALGMPAAAIIGSTQAACLGMQDIRSPLYVLAAAAVVNFLGDAIFVGCKHPWIGGAAGAAWATVFSQYVGVAFFMRWLCHKPAVKPLVMNLSNAIMEVTGKPGSKGGSRRKSLRTSLETLTFAAKEKQSRSRDLIKKLFKGKKPSPKPTTVTAPKEDSFSVRGFLADKFSTKELLKPPSKETRDQFAPYVIPVTSTQVGRVSGYVAMSHVVASSLGTVSMAAQQVIVSLFYCLCPIADSLSLTAQSLVPSVSEKAASRAKANALKKTALNLAKAGAVFGSVMVAAVSAIPLISGMFTSDPVVKSLVNSVVPLLVGFFAVHGVLCGSEGLLLGQKDLNFLGNMYAGYFFAVPYFMLKVKRAALTGSHPVSIASVWQVFLMYQMFRLAAWIGRVGMLQRRADVEGKKADDKSIFSTEGLSKIPSSVPTLAP